MTGGHHRQSGVRARLAAATLWCVLGVIGGAATAEAQNASDARIRIGLNGAVQIADDFSRRTVFRQPTDPSDETGTIDAVYAIERGPGFDAGAIVRVWRVLAVGFSLSYVDVQGDAAFSAAVPHPFEFDAFRVAEGTAASLAHRETAVHLPAGIVVAIGRRASLVVGGGPSFFSVERDFVAGVEYTERFPFETISLVGPIAVSDSASAMGYHVMADASFMFSRHVGAGALVRFARATLEYEFRDASGLAENTVSLEAGGLSLGAGLRFRF
jgi:hypothetical protein